MVFAGTQSVFAKTENKVSSFVPSQTLYEAISFDAQEFIKEIDSIDSIETVLVEKPSKSPEKLKRGECPKSKVKKADSIHLGYINPEKGIDEQYVPRDLVDISQYIQTSKARVVCITEAAATALIAMNDSMKALDMKLVVVSGYRSHAAQEFVYKKYAKINETSEFHRVAPPGHSEHQLGTAVDIAGEFSSGSAFAKTPEGQWVDANAHKYGFILSYPKGGEEKTGYMYEPWHLRFVGVDNAAILHSQKYTLAFKTSYYKESFLTSFLKSLKETIESLANSDDIEIGG
jgi:LAS superfamily LD-carboxypeptidase LdcB